MNERVIDIPNKSWFKIDEVSTITGVKQYILQFWEKEFDQINPDTNSSYESLFSRDDVVHMLMIKRLLFDKRLTVDEVKVKLAQNGINQIELESDEDHNEIEQQENLQSQIAFLQSKLGNILTITDRVKSTHNWCQ